MKNLLNFLFAPIISIIHLLSFVSSMYLSVIFFLILIMEEMLTKHYNQEREGFFEGIIQKLNGSPSEAKKEERLKI